MLKDEEGLPCPQCLSLRSWRSLRLRARQVEMTWRGLPRSMLYFPLGLYARGCRPLFQSSVWVWMEARRRPVLAALTAGRLPGHLTMWHPPLFPLPFYCSRQITDAEQCC